jgi:CubicO group peptidase (beta-lactamase class C family)
MIDQESLVNLLETLRADSNITSLAAGVFLQDELCSAAVGERRRESGIHVTEGDAYQLGSVAKAWNQTLAESFPEIPMCEDFHDVTLEMLLCHRGRFAPDGISEKKLVRTGSYEQNRLAYLTEFLQLAPDPEQPTYSYSNAGYVAASMMLERAAASTWADLLETFIFAPLSMTTASVGASWPQDDADHCTQPWPHHLEQHILRPIQPTSDAVDVPNDFGAGFVRCSMHDLAVFLRAHVRGERGEDGIITSASFRKLHRDHAPGFDYGLGFAIYELDWAHGLTLSHSGSDGFSNVVFWLAPNREFGVCVATNEARSFSQILLNDVIGAILNAVGIN